MFTVSEEQLVLIPTVNGQKQSTVLAVTNNSVAFADDGGSMIVIDRPEAAKTVAVGQIFNFDAAGVGTLYLEPKAKPQVRTGRQGCSAKKENC